MKKLLLVAVATLVCVSAFAQGKLAFINNDDQLTYFSPTQPLAAGDEGKVVGGFALAGQTLSTGAGGTIPSLAGAPSLIAGLFGGTTAGNLTLMTTTTFNTVASGFPGYLNGVNVTLPGLAANVPAFFRWDVYDSRNTSAADAWSMLNRYGGTSGIFQATPAAGAYNPMYAATANSTLGHGTYVPLDYVGFPGYAGLIEVYATVPEPGTFALAGLGLASLLIFRRRK